MLTPYLLIAEVLKPQGVHGEAKLRCDASDPELFRSWKTLYLKEGESYVPLRAECSRVQGGFAYVTLGDCAAPEDVEKLRGRSLYIDRAHAAPLEEGEVYLCDLMGCVAWTREGKRIGKLVDVLQYGPTDVYVLDAGQKRLMVPALPDVFVERDVANDRLVVDAGRMAEVAVDW